MSSVGIEATPGLASISVTMYTPANTVSLKHLYRIQKYMKVLFKWHMAKSINAGNSELRCVIILAIVQTLSVNKSIVQNELNLVTGALTLLCTLVTMLHHCRA